MAGYVPNVMDFVGIGVIPDIEIPKNVNGVIAGKDTELEVAIKEMKKKIK
jgi:C-terminal processing protease CtpA/Prc